MKSRVLASLVTVLLIVPLTSQATLLARDSGGNSVGMDDPTRMFIYDTELDITWLANWNVNGAMDWSTANAWASSLTYFGGGWRLPFIVDTGAPGCVDQALSGTDCGFNVQTKDESTVYSEMAHLWYVTLGNLAYFDTSGNESQPGWGLNNTGPFLNIQSADYWSGTEYVPNLAWFFTTYDGLQSATHQSGTFFYAVAVRSGDVLTASVSEPSTLALLLLGLAGADAMRRRRPGGA
jgi:hypothetical protein